MEFQSEVTFVLNKAISKSNKRAHKDLSLVEILSAYEEISDQFSQENRAKIYLALLEFKKQTEFELMQEIDNNIEESYNV